MKRLLIVATLLVALFSLTGCPSPNTPGTLPYTPNSWLIVMYMDADNNLNDSIWTDIYNTQIGLAYAMNAEGSAESGYPDLKVIMLWDGWNEDSCQELRDEHTYAIIRPAKTRIHPRSELYELRPMDQNTYDAVNASGNPDKTWRMSSISRRLTNSVTWLPEEPDMGNVSTLTNLLTWVNNNYNAEHKVLVLNNHGAGTEQEAGSGGAFYHRSLCSDDTNSTDQSVRSLTATDVKNAIANSGFHPKVIWMDCCLQGNVETTYILRGSADYLVTSANVSYSNNYYRIISNLNNVNTPLEFAKTVASSYAATHASNTLDISSTSVTDLGTRRSSYERTLTQAVYNLDVGKQGLLYGTIDALAGAILSENETVKNRIFTEYLNQTRTSVQNCKGMAYPGTAVYLSDIGYFCNKLISDSSLSVTIKNCAQNVVSALNNVIESSWMGKYVVSYDSDTAANPIPTLSTNFYYKKNLDSVAGTSDYDASDGQFGLTIMTQTYDNRFNNGYYYFLTEYNDFTGYSPNWGQLLDYWYNTISNPQNP